MKRIVLESVKITTREDLFTELKEQMQAEAFYGNNRDAFYDVLTTYPESVEIAIQHEELFKENLGIYGERFIRVYQEYRQELEL